jgi:glycosyltransferase involved in cell wall biosynthesis
MLPYYFRHYDAITDRYFIFDDASTDASLDILAKHPKVEIDRFYKQPESFVEGAHEFNNNIWKKSRNKADWVIICNIDEHLYHPDLLVYLKQCRDEGITVIPAEGYQMISDSFPDADGRLCDLVTRGMPYKKMSKLCIFNPDAIEEINYEHGRHHADPTGRVVYPQRKDLKLLHYKYPELDYLITRFAELSTGLRRIDLEKGWGSRYLLERKKIEQSFQDVWVASFEVPFADVGSEVKAMGKIEQLRYQALLKIAGKWRLLKGRYQTLRKLAEQWHLLKRMLMGKK